MPRPDDTDRDRLFDLLNGLATSQIVAAAAQLDLADHLSGGPLTIAQLAGRTGTQLEPLRRLVQAWCALGLVAHADPPGHYGATSLLAPLSRSAPASLAGMAELFGREYYLAWSELLHTVRTGTSGFERHYRTSFWNYLADHDRAARAFDHAMSFNASRSIAAIVADYDFGDARLIVDIGAGNAELLAAVLARHPACRGIAFDLPHVAGSARATLDARGLAARCDVAAGDFFEALPAGGDLYLLKAVLHNWDDERALRILRNCRAAMPRRARLLVVENPGPASTGELADVLKDLWMMVMFGGRDRSGDDYRQLLEAAGFAEIRIIAGARNPMLIEARAS